MVVHKIQKAFNSEETENMKKTVKRVMRRLWQHRKHQG